ncbi:MAG: TIGR03032 family protein [Burkholderiales bacterium]|nr:TIGR03032 family protein [Burkholderiales bacterium]
MNLHEMPEAPGAAPAEPQFELSTSRQFPNFLAEQRLGIAFTTYQAGKVFLLGLKPDGRVSVFERTLERCMGMVAGPGTLHIATLYQIWRFCDVLAPGTLHEGHDALYAPRMSWVTGDLDVHDLGLLPDGRPVFANTLFSCVATVSDSDSFVPLWKPRFISRLAAEDRCHLNGLALEGGRPRYVTVVGRSDVADGWREHRAGGGCVIDIESGEVVAGGLSMPHSPRLHDGRLWLHNSGTGEFGWIDPQAGRFEPVTFCPGYLRGLAFVGNFALVGLSLSRENRTFSGLALDDALTQRGAEARCGLMVIDLKTGDAVHWVRLGGVVRELYDVVALPGVVRPSAIGFKADSIRRVITIGAAAAS